MKQGKFIVFGGLDQTGKSTQSKKLAEWLESRGIPCIYTREPGGTPFGERIRHILLDPSLELSATTQLLMYQAVREEHLNTVIRPALREGKWVVCDRFFESSYLYQGMQGIPDDKLILLHTLLGQNLPAVDLHFLFVGTAGHRENEEKTHYDRFSEAFRDQMTERIIRFSRLMPTAILDVNNRCEYAVFDRILETLQETELL